MTTRREFLKVSALAGGGLALGFRLPAARAQNSGAELNAWVLVYPDERVVIRYARSEMGQGSMTSAAQLVAEELEVDWSRVRVEHAETNAQVRRGRPWGDMAAVGSRTIRQSQQALRTAGAAARTLLVAAAAENWGVPPEDCTASQGFVYSLDRKKSASYGQLAAAAARLEAPREVKLKDPKDWKLVGTPVPRVDIPDIVQGRARYGVDVQLPGMVHAAVAQCPVFGGRLRSVDSTRVEKRRGVLKVLPMRDWVAVVADNWWRAKEALAALPVQWEAGDGGASSSATIENALRGGLDDPRGVANARREGDVEGTMARAARLVEAEYFTPYLAHATLEPQNCTALVKRGRVDVWVPTQDAEGAHRAAAAEAGVAPERVYVHRTSVGGGFGRRGMQDFVRMGVALAKAMEGTPVKMLWSREEDMQHDYYRPASRARFRASLDAAGRPTAWYCRVAAPSILGTLFGAPLPGGVDRQATAALADMPYELHNVHVEYVRRDSVVPVGFWRTVGHSQNPFMRECFLDELAHAAGQDPLLYRLALLPFDSREKAILEKAAHAAGWHRPPPAGVHRGLAVTEAYGSYTAAVAELSVAGGKVDIRRLVVGIDPGHAVNPGNIEAQMQGSAAFALTALFWGEITVQDGRVAQSNFHDQRLLRLREMPKVEVVLAPSGGFWGGIGEPGQAAITPAICNAIFAATGKPVRSLPLAKSGLEPA